MPLLRALAQSDAAALLAFYNGLSSASIRTFRPLGSKTSLSVCQQIVAENAALSPSRFDLVACEQGAIVGWSFIERLTSDHPNLGIAVADHRQGLGVGTALILQTLAGARRLELTALYLMVVQDNVRAIRWYERHGFAKYGEEFDAGDQLPYFHMVARTLSAEKAMRVERKRS
ncbi:MAG: GNAT family N-acetyltransferase [Deltaproteobacteria bacterium]